GAPRQVAGCGSTGTGCNRTGRAARRRPGSCRSRQSSLPLALYVAAGLVLLAVPEGDGLAARGRAGRVLRPLAREAPAGAVALITHLAAGHDWHLVWQCVT